MGFKWKDSFYCYTVLAFGLSSAPYLFTKCLKPIVKYWRENGVDIVLYLDDGLGFAKDRLSCDKVSSFVQQSLVEAGLLINYDKSIFNPVQNLEWLGMVWNSVEYSISITGRRIDDTMASLENILILFPFFSARNLARVIGKIMSMYPVIGDLTCLMSRFSYIEIDNRNSWDSLLKRDFLDTVHTELQFWFKNLISLNKKSLVSPRLTKRIVYSDASSTAAGAYIVDLDDQIFYQTWTDAEINTSSTSRELKAILLAMRSYTSFLKSQKVVWYTDSKNCASIVKKGSTKQHLQVFALEIHQLCSKYDIDIDIKWIPRSENSKADYISKIIDHEDWGTTYDFFNFMNELWGPFTVDRFANSKNFKVSRFNTKFWCEETEAVDAFSQNWVGENNWLVPPIALIIRVIDHLLLCKARGTLIVPNWPSSPFWTRIFVKGYQYHKYVMDVLEFEPNQNIFIHGENESSIFGSDKFTSKVLAIKLDAMHVQ